MAQSVPAIVIAAGGDGQRLGGGKAQRLLGGRRLLDHALAWAQAQSDAVALAMRPDAPDLGVGVPLLVDQHSSIGPITALASAFRFARAQHRGSVLMIGCDMPFLPANLVTRLAAALPGHGAAMPVSDGRWHPMAALWSPDVTALDAYIARGRQALWGFAKSVGVVELVWDAAPGAFLNVNLPADLALAEALLARAGDRQPAT